MFPPVGSSDSQGNELHIGTNCLGPYLLYSLLVPRLSETASVADPGAVRVAWAGSSGIDLISPKPHGMQLEEDGRPVVLGVAQNYAVSKVGNLFLAKEMARRDESSGVLHCCYNPGNLRTELQRHWISLESTFTVRDFHDVLTELYQHHAGSVPSLSTPSWRPHLALLGNIARTHP